MTSIRLKLNDDKTEIALIGNNVKTLAQATTKINGHLISRSKKMLE